LCGKAVVGFGPGLRGAVYLSKLGKALIRLDRQRPQFQQDRAKQLTPERNFLVRGQ
jgi:hypothetical protein